MKEYGCKPLQGKSAQYMLYYVMEQNAPSTAIIAVVGVDFSMNKSQHYKYFSCNSTHGGRAMYSKKKADVKKWLLEVFGVAVAAQKAVLARIPEPTEATVQQILLDNADKRDADTNVVSKIKCMQEFVPVKLCKTGVPREEVQPQIKNVPDQQHDHVESAEDGSTVTDIPEAIDLLEAADLPEAALPVLDDPGKLTGWTRWMQVEHRQESGSLCRRFLLLDDRMPHRQLVAVTAVEVDAKKEAFFYQATEELGAHCFKNRSEAISWIYKHFFRSCQDTPSSSPKHQLPHELAHGLRAEEPCTNNNMPNAEMLEWAAATASQLAEHSECATKHSEQRQQFEEELPKVYQLLTELASPQVGLMLLAQCNDLTTAVTTAMEHPEPGVAQKAQELVAGWEQRAQLVEKLSKKAMQQDGELKEH